MTSWWNNVFERHTFGMVNRFQRNCVRTLLPSIGFLRHYWIQTGSVSKTRSSYKYNVSMLYIRGKFVYMVAQYTVGWTAKSDLHFTHWQTGFFRHQLDLSGKHSSHAAIAREDNSFRCPPLCIYSRALIYTAEWTTGVVERTKMPKLRNGSKGYFNPGSLDSGSPIFYRCAPFGMVSRVQRNCLHTLMRPTSFLRQ